MNRSWRTGKKRRTVRRAQDYVTASRDAPEAGAGEGNRTLVCSLGSCRSAIELHPQCPHFIGCGCKIEKIQPSGHSRGLSGSQAFIRQSVQNNHRRLPMATEWMGTRTSPFSMRRTVERDAPMRSASEACEIWRCRRASEMSLPSLRIARSTGRGIGDSMIIVPNGFFMIDKEFCGNGYISLPPCIAINAPMGAFKHALRSVENRKGAGCLP